MRGKSFVIVIVIIVGAFFAGTIVMPSAKAATLYVGGSGPGNYTTIQGAIDVASPGDTIYVYNGTYRENVVIDKTLSLIGNGRDTTVIDGGGSDVVQVSANWVSITGFTIMNSTTVPPPQPQPPDPGIVAMGVSNLNVFNNSVQDHRFGIYLTSSEENTIVNNIFRNNTDSAVYVEFSRDNMIADNNFSTGSVGLNFEGSSGNTIDRNVFWDLGKGIFGHWLDRSIITNNTTPKSRNGLQLRASEGTFIAYNNFSAVEYGIHMWASGYITITHNIISTNRFSGTGVYFEVTNENTIMKNTFSGNAYGLVFAGGDRERVYHNIFRENEVHACQSGRYGFNYFDDSYPSGGNYWDDHSGVDEKRGYNQDQPGADGIFDTPYKIPTAPTCGLTPLKSVDKYPLVGPFIPGALSAPTNLEAKAGFKNVTLTWQSPLFDGGSPTTNYSIYRGTAPGAETFLLEVGNIFTFVDTGLIARETYYYKVSAKNAFGEGPKSNEASATTTVSCKLPLNLIGIPGIEDVFLHWTPPKGPGRLSTSDILGADDTTSSIARTEPIAKDSS
jgi:parallel beta-helix repeat protein